MVKKILWSASEAARRGRYACFAMPLAVESYCPNALLSAVRHASSPTNQRVYTALLECIRSSVLAPGTLHTELTNPEKEYTDIVLRTIMYEVANQIDAMVRDDMHIAGANVTAKEGSAIGNVLKFHLAKSTSEPEYAAVCPAYNAVLVVSEAKSLKASTLDAMAQCMQICGDGALSLRARGLDLPDCVVPGILCAGRQWEVVGVALMPHTYPFMVTLSRPLSFVSDVDRQQLATYVYGLLAPAAGIVHTRRIRVSRPQHALLRFLFAAR